MKIAIVCDILGKINNGTTMAAYNLINYLKQKGHDVIVLCPDKDKENIPGFVVLKKRNFGPLNFYMAKNGVNLAKPDKKLIETVIKDCDAVHCLLPFLSGVSALRIAKKYGIPVTASFHCQAEHVTCHLKLNNFKLINDMMYKRYYKRMFRHADAVHYPTEFIMNVFEKVVGSTPGYIISNGVNEIVKPIKTDKPKEYADKIVIFSIGRLSMEKAHMVILKAIARSKYADRIQMIIAGDGPQYNKLTKYAKKNLPIQPVIRFFPREEVVKMLNYADLCVHPAEIELEGIGCLEAIVCGLVPIVSDSKKSATKNFSLSKNNIFKCGDAEDLKNKIEYWIENPDKKEEFKEKYLKLGINFNQQECMGQMEQMLFDAVKMRSDLRTVD